MKKIEAIIRKSRFEDVKKALLAADIEWFSYYNVRGEGKMRQARIFLWWFGAPKEYLENVSYTASVCILLCLQAFLNSPSQYSSVCSP